LVENASYVHLVHGGVRCQTSPTENCTRGQVDRVTSHEVITRGTGRCQREDTTRWRLKGGTTQGRGRGDSGGETIYSDGEGNTLGVDDGSRGGCRAYNIRGCRVHARDIVAAIVYSVIDFKAHIQKSHAGGTSEGKG